LPLGYTGTLNQLKEVMVNNDKNDPFDIIFWINSWNCFMWKTSAGKHSDLVALARFSSPAWFVWSGNLFCRTRVKKWAYERYGATVFNLASLYQKNFLKLVLIANGIAFR